MTRPLAGHGAQVHIATNPRGGVPPEGIVHLGLGSFHRAHQAVYTARAVERAGGDWGIVGVAHADPRIVKTLRRQGGRYTVLELGATTRRAEVVHIHGTLLVGAHDPEAVVARIAHSRTRVVTITVTERGYTFDAGTRRLDVHDPALASDMTGSTPRTAVGQLASGLQRRYEAGGEPIALVSCDNIIANGTLLRDLVLEYVERQAGPVPSGMHDWVAQGVGFPSTMVDRIVPRTTSDHRDLAERLVGWRDEAVVPTEPFSMWVVEDDFPGGRPAWELAGARLGGEVKLFERLKLGLLNAPHSLVAYLGVLDGCTTIAEAVAVPAIREAAEHLMQVDITPTLEPPAGVEPRAYGAEVLDRFANPQIGHHVWQVGSDGATKLPQRVGEPCRARLEEHTVPTGIALLLAAYLRTMSGDDGIGEVAGSAPRLVDPERENIRAAVAAGQPIRQTADQVLARTGVVTAEAPHRDALLDLVAHLFETLGGGGIASAVREAVAATQDAT